MAWYHDIFLFVNLMSIILGIIIAQLEVLNVHYQMYIHLNYGYIEYNNATLQDLNWDYLINMINVHQFKLTLSVRGPILEVRI